MTFYPSDNAQGRDLAVSPGPGVLLASYHWGMAARRAAAGPPERVAGEAARQIARFHPELAEAGMIRDRVSWSWDTHPWSAGAYAWFLPGQHTELLRHVEEPEGRILFAGEHASAHSSMQEALESGVRAAGEVQERA